MSYRNSILAGSLHGSGRLIPFVFWIGILLPAFLSPTARGQFMEDFDGVTAPALPPGWTAINASGAAPLWVTTTVSPFTPPNSAFVDAPASVSDKRLETPDILIPLSPSPVQLYFRHGFGFEPSWDGGVLEISIAGAPFQDILAAGGSFVEGGYTHTLNAPSANPLVGRAAWSGASFTYIETLVNLPALAGGQYVRLRFRMGSNQSSGGGGWQIDSMSIFCTLDVLPPEITCPADVTVTGEPGQTSAVVTFAQPSATDNCIAIVQLGCSPPSGSTFPEGDSVVECTATDAAGNVGTCSFVVRVEIAEAGDPATAAPPPAAQSSCPCAPGVFPAVGLFGPLMLFGRRLRRRRKG